MGINQLYTDYNPNEEQVKDYQKYERTIKTINKRFKTYGYERLKTPTFEQYDLYAQVTSSINQKEMIKTIGRDGEVFVLRPDVTIPITKQLSNQNKLLANELRYFYVQDVFRQPQLEDEEVESTQAGVEYFCESSPEADAEVIALACHTLKDLGFRNIKIEIGHAGFFQQLIEKASFTDRQLLQLKNLIQSKNIIEIEPFLKSLKVDDDLIKAFVKIPMLYGDPVEINNRARKIVKTTKMADTLDYLLEVYDILKLYGLEDHIVMDLGLINHMGYYSDIIFQGYVEKFGKPVLMGGRYNHLGNEFGAWLPAIGFACTVESLMKAMQPDYSAPRMPIDVKINYDENSLQESIIIANELRERNYTVISTPVSKDLFVSQPSIYEISITPNKRQFFYKEESYCFGSIQELIKLMNGAKGVM